MKAYSRSRGCPEICPLSWRNETNSSQNSFRFPERRHSTERRQFTHDSHRRVFKLPSAPSIWDVALRLESEFSWNTHTHTHGANIQRVFPHCSSQVFCFGQQVKFRFCPQLHQTDCVSEKGECGSSCVLCAVTACCHSPLLCRVVTDS